MFFLPIHQVADRDRFLDEVYAKQKLKVTVVKADAYDPRVRFFPIASYSNSFFFKRYQYAFDLEQLREYGITHYLDQVFEAPSVVSVHVRLVFKLIFCMCVF